MFYRHFGVSDNRVKVLLYPQHAMSSYSSALSETLYTIRLDGMCVRESY